MSQTPNTAIAVIGIDIGKNSFHLVGHDARGAWLGLVPKQISTRDSASLAFKSSTGCL
jgi:transposase